MTTKPIPWLWISVGIFILVSSAAYVLWAANDGRLFFWKTKPDESRQLGYKLRALLEANIVYLIDYETYAPDLDTLSHAQKIPLTHLESPLAPAQAHDRRYLYVRPHAEEQNNSQPVFLHDPSWYNGILVLVQLDGVRVIHKGVEAQAIWAEAVKLPQDPTTSATGVTMEAWTTIPQARSP